MVVPTGLDINVIRSAYNGHCFASMILFVEAYIMHQSPNDEACCRNHTIHLYMLLFLNILMQLTLVNSWRVEQSPACLQVLLLFDECVWDSASLTECGAAVQPLSASKGNGAWDVFRGCPEKVANQAGLVATLLRMEPTSPCVCS